MKKNCTQYFASRNGFDGFTSYFKDVFAPELFTKIFILKGGPGTGKSTLMKKLYASFSLQSDNTECILCSSDKNSLDGLIVEKDGRRIAFLDGTAPHTTDPSLPIVCEEIINLGEAIDNTEITTHRETLFELYKKKSDEYKLAYHFLLVCGEISRNYSAVFDLVDERNEKDNLFFVLEKLPYAHRGIIKKRLYTSFGKDGFYELETANPENYTIYNFNKNSRYAQVILDKLQRGLYECIFVLNSFDGEVESVYIPSLMIKLIFSERKEIDTALLSIYKEAMEIAKSHFSVAADVHFEMEKYYTAALNFDILNHIFETLKEKTKVILSIS